MSASAAAPSRSTTVTGAGPALEFPIYEELGTELSAHRITLNYQQTDPNAAASAFAAGRIAFLAADGVGAPLGVPRHGATNAQAVPVARWGVAVIYNLPSLRVRLRLDGATLADMYRGVVKNWNSGEIARENPGVKLPAIPIRVVHRADGAVATAVLTHYLADASLSWRRTVGSGTKVRWSGGTAAANDTALVATVAQNAGAIGYTEQSVALLDGVPTAALRNASGEFVAPMAAAATAGTYPALAQTYLLTYRDLCVAGLTPRQASAVRTFALYLLGQGQAVIKRLRFSPLPRPLRLRALSQVAGLLCESQQVT